MTRPRIENWRKSSRSGGVDGNCVEVGFTSEVVGLRDSKDRDGGTLYLTRDQWRGLVAVVKDGELDRPSA